MAEDESPSVPPGGFPSTFTGAGSPAAALPPDLDLDLDLDLPDDALTDAPGQQQPVGLQRTLQRRLQPTTAVKK